ncbi:hypothetical protein BU26DRAFT_313133 [Trematosphaeria pertusa]|uniref:Uncharacterized protein n=1 Tax=Trematosphaeria pertusa TaxID=390896 RepID=A0A6A6IFH0_9PLEO|nr:uncharacterized protein BU26DRAFT_313133 [Trematosphaeria pertusa]KAF2249156.1 hypothetical protein BU26DRAFT_313133 [Trematosphaeria pertusa]
MDCPCLVDPESISFLIVRKRNWAVLVILFLNLWALCIPSQPTATRKRDRRIYELDFGSVTSKARYEPERWSAIQSLGFGIRDSESSFQDLADLG